MRSRGNEPWCESTEDEPNETYEEEKIYVQEPYQAPPPWKVEDE